MNFGFDGIVDGERRARARRWVRHAAWIARVVLPAIFAASAGLAHAQAWPTRPIKLIVPWPAGGGVDTAARMISEPLAQRLGQPIIVDNRPGAAGNIGTAIAAHEKPDGYTLLMASLVAAFGQSAPLHASSDSSRSRTSRRSRSCIRCRASSSCPASSPANTAQELVALAKASPGKLNFGSGGAGSSQHLFGVMFNTATKIDTVHIPYKGTSPAEQGLVAGQVDYMLDPPTCLPFVTAGRLKALAVAAPKRNPELPNVPTLDELGIKGVYTLDLLRRRGAGGHAQGNRREAQRRDQRDPARPTTCAPGSPSSRAEPGSGTPEEFGRFMESEIKRYGEIVRISGREGRRLIRRATR